MKDNFNSNFYITAATVIPLLYITLFLQSQMAQNPVKGFHDLSARIDKVFEDWSTNGRTWISRSTASIVRYLYEAVGGLLIVVIRVLPLAGIAAEGFSLLDIVLSIRQQHNARDCPMVNARASDSSGRISYNSNNAQPMVL